MALYVDKVSDTFIRKLAQEYLTDYATMKKLAKQYHTSPGTISNILFKGVSERIIDEITSVAITTKVISFTENVYKTDRRWQKAINLREIPLVEADIQQAKAELELVQFQLETYKDYFFDDDSAPSKKALKCKRAQIKGRITTLEQRLKKLKG